MRIVAIIGQFRPLVGGTETHAASMARLWADEGHQVEIWTRLLAAGHPRLEGEGRAVVRRLGWAGTAATGFFNKSAKATFAAALFARLLQKRGDYDLVIAHQTLYPALIAASAKRFTSRPLVLRNASTGVTSDYRAWGAFKGPILSAFRSAGDAIVVTNRQGAQEARAAGFEEGRIGRIPNGIDPGPAVGSRPVPKTPRFVYVGGLRAEKRVDLLLRAWASAGSPGDLALAGDGPLRVPLETLARDLKISPRFLGNVADPSALLRESDVFVLPSDAEGMSNALLEAMSCSCACLATFVGGNIDCLAPEATSPPVPGEILKGSAGFLCACGDEEALARGLLLLARDPELRQTLGDRARARVVLEFNVDHVAAAYLKLFESLLRPAGDAGRP